MSNKTAIGTRFFGKPEDEPRFIAWLEGAIHTTGSPEAVFVAVNTAKDTLRALEFLAEKYPKVNAFAVTPWDNSSFAAPLNALIRAATMQGFSKFLSTSVEYAPTPVMLNILDRYMLYHTLQVGARLADHDFLANGNKSVDVPAANGRQVPWATYSLFNLDRASMIGFQPISDLGENAGVEELVFGALHQTLAPRNTSVDITLVDTGLLPELDTTGWSEDRFTKQAQKMQSKSARPEAQMTQLCKFYELDGPSVTHIQHGH